MRQNALLACASCLFGLLILEAALRVAVSYGVLSDHDLPPVPVLPDAAVLSSPAADSGRSDWYKRLVVDGQRITVGDLWGLQREDSVLGYAPREDAVSVNGWWQSNNIGARARAATLREKPAYRRRLLVFGDSFAQGSRVPQEASWPAILGSQSPGLDVVNLGVDGYSLAQAFLRYQEIRTKIHYDLVLLMFVPRASLWRDINTMRDLAAPWQLYQVLPRFVVEGEELKLIRSPYTSRAELVRKNTPRLSEELRLHLLKYDRFYFTSKYEEPVALGPLLSYKFVARAYYQSQTKALRRNIFDAWEGLKVSRRIFETMRDVVAGDGNRLAVIVLPSDEDIALRRSDVTYRDKWYRMVRSACGPHLPCIDLSEDLELVPIDQLDRGYDDSHYGPKANQRIAELIRNHLERLNLIEGGVKSGGGSPAGRAG